jgi:Na+-translocating ferredoxin:NAD+ oxidoreductase RnfD subunit
VTSRALTIRGGSYPLVLPSLRDPRLHVAAVIISIHILGQVGLHFEVSVPQILAAIVTCAIIEITLTFRQTRSFVWPASAMLTGSGVALILRVGSPPDQPWNTDAWWVFAVIAGLSLLTKYVIQYRGSHVFNPSNVGLVAAFVVLGSTRVEPLDFWWGPLDVWMVTAYALIIVGGILITRRLHLLAMALTFWTALAIGTGILAASGHCMTADWAFSPVCGVDFWRVIVTSPEVLIFLFFMLTDPKTIPSGRVGRLAFALLVAVVSTLLMAPQTTEFGTKVGLLAGLVLACAARPLFERWLPEPRSAADDVGWLAGRLVFGRGPGVGPTRRVIAISGIAATVVLVSGGIVLAGTPARDLVGPDTARMLGEVPHQVDPATFPAISVDVPAWDDADAGSIARGILTALAEDLELETQALLRGDASILAASDHGDRLADMQDRLRDAEASGRTVVGHYRFDSVHVVVIAPFGVQSGGSIGFESSGTVTTETYDRDGALLDRQTAPFDLTFAVRRPTGDRWLIVGVFPPGANESG